MNQYLTAKQFADRFVMHEKTVRDMVLRGEIDAIRVAGPKSSIRISEQAIEAWEASRRKASA